MVLTAFVWFVIWGIGSAALFGIGWVITVIVQGNATAAELANAWFFSFNGIITGAAGYGLVFFMRSERRALGQAIKNIIDVPEVHAAEFERRLGLLTKWRLTPLVAVLLTVIGSYIAYRAGIPLHGFAHVYLSLAVFSFYWVGACGLMVIIAVLYLFRFVEDHCDARDANRISLKYPFRSQDVQMIDLFFIVSSAMCIFAVYVCFRGTLTAFAGAPPLFYKALIIPVFFFLPASLVYSFYPRHVLRHVWETDTFVAVDQFAKDTIAETTPDLKAQLEMRKLIFDVKEKMLAERRALPLLSFRDAPTLTMAILMAVQLIAQKDPIVSSFLGLTGK